MIELSGVTLNVGDRVARGLVGDLWLDGVISGIDPNSELGPVIHVLWDGADMPMTVGAADLSLHLPCGGCKGTLLRIKPLGTPAGWPYTRKLNGKPLCADCTDEIMDAEQAADEERAG